MQIVAHKQTNEQTTTVLYRKQIPEFGPDFRIGDLLRYDVGELWEIRGAIFGGLLGRCLMVVHTVLEVSGKD